MTDIKWPAVAIVAVLLLGIGAGIAWWITATVYDKDIAQLNAARTKDQTQYTTNLKAISDKATQDTTDAINRMKAAQDALAALDKQKSQELADAQAKNDALKRDVADGARRVRIAEASLATTELAARQHTAGGSTGAGGVGDAATLDLTPDAGQSVLDIRAGIINDDAKLDYLQSYVTDIVKQCKR
jgi:prophage endopeptidase